MKSVLFLLFPVFLLQGCVSTKTINVMSEEKITGPKVIAMSGSRSAWVYEIEKRLKSSGFQIKRMVSQNSSVEKVSDTKTDIYKEASSQYVLHIDGYCSGIVNLAT